MRAACPWPAVCPERMNIAAFRALVPKSAQSAAGESEVRVSVRRRLASVCAVAVLDLPGRLGEGLPGRCG